MKTGSFRTYQGPGRICIARYAPRGTPAGFKIYRALAPGSWFNSVTKEEYIERFNAEILAPLNPQRVHDQLVTLAGDAEPVLLCYEVPPFTEKNYCHRRMVAEWFEKHLGIEVPELVIAPKSEPVTGPVPQTSMF